MTLHNRFKDPGFMIRTGLVLLIVSSLLRLFLKPSVHISAGMIDAALGFFYGITIACLLLAVRLRVRRRTTTGSGCA